MGYVYNFDCRNMDEETIKTHIQKYEQCGWTFKGFSNFPPPHEWAVFNWQKEGEPIYPEK